MAHNGAISPRPRPITFQAKGHVNIKATHHKTFELTACPDVTERGTCIIGLDVTPPVEELLRLRGPVEIDLQCGGAADTVSALINPLFISSDPMIVRIHPEPQHNTLCIAADKAAADLDRELIAALAAPGAELSVTFRAQSPAARVLPGALFVVAVPIGNRGDLSPRAKATLASVDIILAEDTRTARALIGPGRAEYLSLHDHNERGRVPEILDRLSGGARIALVSEAGTPLISDPGYSVVRAATAAGHLVVPVPGPDAVTAALCASGLPTDDFRFLGFLPRKAGERGRRLGQIKQATYTSVFFEAPHRIVASLEAIADELGSRPVTVCRNITKPGEEFLRGTAGDVADRLRSRDAVRGEFTIVVGPGEATAGGEPITPELERVANSLLAQGVATKTVAAALAEATGASRRDMFAYILSLRKRDGFGGSPTDSSR